MTALADFDFFYYKIPAADYSLLFFLQTSCFGFLKSKLHHPANLPKLSDKASFFSDVVKIFPNLIRVNNNAVPVFYTNLTLPTICSV